MRKLYKKIENWLWIVFLIGALIYFHWLVGNLHIEAEALKESQKNFGQEIEEKYQKSKNLQAEIQVQLNEVAQDVLNFLKIRQAPDCLNP